MQPPPDGLLTGWPQFNIIMDDTDVLLDDLQEWKRSDLSDHRPPPLVIEVFVDTSNLSQNQTLVMEDETGRRWDVSDALASSGSAGSSPRPPVKNGGRACEVVLERWLIELGEKPTLLPGDQDEQLANVYKKGVVLFRSLYTFLRFLPAWKLHRRLSRQPHAGNQQGLRLNFRIRKGDQGVTPQGAKDSLYTPLCPSELSTSLTTSTTDPDHFVHTHHVPPLRTRAGLLHLRVEYRASAAFGAVDSEYLLSSRFLSRDQGLPPTLSAAGRSLPGARTSERASESEKQSRTQYGSAADSRTSARQPRAMLAAYGSLGTFHATGKRESPLSALQHQLNASDYDEEEDRNDDEHMEAVLKLTQGEIDQQSYERRRSLLFQQKSPFKAGSLSSSPRSATQIKEGIPTTKVPSKDSRTASATSVPSSIPREKRVSLNTLPQQALRAPPSDTAIASSGSSSPRPAPVQRYSSSFSNRTRRQPSNATSQTGRSGGSGGSSTRNSTTDQAGGASSAAQSDEDSIADFVRLLEGDKVKNHALSRPASRGNGVTTVNLSKYSMMRDPSSALADEMSASSLIQGSSGTPPSRRLSNVPGLSTSSSPSRVLAYQPHVRSRLSTHSIAEENSRHPQNTARGPPVVGGEDEEGEDEPFIFPQEDIE